VGYIPAHVADSIPSRVADLVREVGEQCARADKAEAEVARMKAKCKPTTENRYAQPTPETTNAAVHAVCREFDDFDAVPAEVCAEIERDRDNWRAMAVMSPDRLDAALRDRERTAKRLRRMVGIALGYRRQRDAHRWIPVGERLPELATDVLAWFHSNGAFVTSYHGRYGWNESEYFGPGTPTHWQPLPEPPSDGKAAQ
jgi:hypothetical protein